MTSAAMDVIPPRPGRSRFRAHCLFPALEGERPFCGTGDVHEPCGAVLPQGGERFRPADQSPPGAARSRAGETCLGTVLSRTSLDAQKSLEQCVTQGDVSVSHDGAPFRGAEVIAVRVNHWWKDVAFRAILPAEEIQYSLWSMDSRICVITVRKWLYYVPGACPVAAIAQLAAPAWP